MVKVINVLTYGAIVIGVIFAIIAIKILLVAVCLRSVGII